LVSVRLFGVNKHVESSTYKISIDLPRQARLCVERDIIGKLGHHCNLSMDNVEIMEIMDWCYELDGLVVVQNSNRNNGDSFSETVCVAGRVSVPVFDCSRGAILVHEV
jgi:hypothetical protein